MQKFMISLLIFFLITGNAAFAGSGHSHGPATPITKAQALKKATNIVKNFVKKSTLAPSWAERKPAFAEKRQSKYGPEWVIVFDNPGVKDKEKQTLYVFLTLSGQFIAANYSGN